MIDGPVLVSKRVALVLGVAAVVAIALVLILKRPEVDKARLPPVASVESLPSPELPTSEPAELVAPEPDHEEEQAVDGDSDCADRYAEAVTMSNFEANQAVYEASDRIRASVDPELILAAASIDKLKFPEQSMESLQRIGGENTSSPVALMTLMDLCDQRKSANCDRVAIERNIRRNHSANGVLWVGLAGQMLDAGREDAAFDAIGQAIAAPVFDNYFDDQLMLLERGLAASTDWSYAQRVFHSVEFAISNAPGVLPVIRLCETKQDGQWPMLCDQLAERLTDYEGDFGANAVGLELKTKMLEARGDSEGMAKLEKSIAGLKNMFEDEGQLKEMVNALLNDEVLLRTFLENLSASGEIAAYRLLTDDIERIKATDGYDQCNFVDNPYVRL